MGCATTFLSPCYSDEETILAATKAPTPTKEDSTSGKPQNIDLAKVSQAFGNFLGRTLSNPNIGIHFDIDNVIKGLREGYAGKPSPMTDQEYEQAIAALQEKEFNALAEKNLKAATEFMAENAKAKNIVVVEPGKLQYEVLKEGSGASVPEHGTPLINYTGKFIDGTEFGSSKDSGPISISLDRTITGFSKGLVGMKQNEKRRLFIHPDLAYGNKGDFPPNALLIFEVEVVEPNTTEKADKESSSADYSHDDDQADATPPDTKKKPTDDDDDFDEDDDDDDDDVDTKKKPTPKK